MTTATANRESIFASVRAREQAHELAYTLSQAEDAASIEILGVKPGREILSLLQQIINIIGEGGTVTVGSLPEILSTTVAAEILGVSRPTLMKHVRNGDIPSRQAGSHTRLHRDDVLAFRKERLQKQRDALDELLSHEDELGL